MTEKKSNGNELIATPSAAYLAMVDSWDLVDALHSGTTGMRAADVKYLPQEPREEQSAYRLRLERSVLFPGLKKSIRNLTGKAFASSVNFKNLTPEWEEWFENINLAGATIQQFASDVFLSGLKYGHTSMLAEYPKVPQASTLYTERQIIKARPYLVHRPARQLIGWRTELRNNEETLSRVRVRECFTSYGDQWSDDGEQVQIRVLELGGYAIYREDSDGNWYLAEKGEVSIKDKVPLMPVYFDREGTLQSQVPLLDLAWTNVAHWQSYSDQRNILRIARVPIVLIAGADEKEIDSLTIGPNRFLALRNPNAKMNFVEHSGAAITAGRQDCVDLEERMYIQGSEPMMTRAGSDTATGRTIDARDATSPLATWVSGFEHSMNETFKLMAEYGGTDTAPEIQMTRDFGILGNTSDLDALLKMRLAGEISREAFLEEMKRRGVLGEMFSADDDAEKIAAEPPMNPQAGGFGATDKNGDPVAKGDGDNVAQ